MNKQTYFRMMGLMIKRARYTAPELDLWKALGVDPAAVNNAKAAVTRAKGAQGQLGVWEYIWNWIRRFFGSEEGKQLLERHDARNKAISDAESAWKAFYTPKQGISLTPDQSRLLSAMQASDRKKIDQRVAGGKAAAAKTPGTPYETAFGSFLDDARTKDQQEGWPPAPTPDKTKKQTTD